ncbi:MAG: polymerase, sigma-24 subunit, subfamily [Mucilaginibacter sp.]|nr:polymerase, sigma-24 subunit, subfamily [Mucilaginibacter sp.]
MATRLPLNEQELSSFFAKGDETAFERVFSYFYEPLCYFASQIVKDPFTAEDIVQDILLKAWQRHNNFERVSSLRSFLYMGVKNAGFDYLDHQGVKSRHESNIAAQLTVQESDILQILMDTELANQLFSLVDTLPEQCRKVIRMTFEEGLKPAEVAAKLGVTVSTVNNQKMRGLKLLKDRLTDEDLGLALTALIFFHLTNI